MPVKNDPLRNRLSQSSEITITVTGRKSGRPISIPVWFVLNGDKLYLLPVHGSDTQWHKNMLNNPKIRIGAREEQTEVQAVPIFYSKQVLAVVEEFRGQEGGWDVEQ